MADQNTFNSGMQGNPGIQTSVPIQPTPVNPLQKHFRQPKIYIKLPSGGKYWRAGSIDVPENGEFPVYSMTAKDELVLKTPDALMNGDATARLMSSCIPNIKDGFQCPSIDLDAILVAIRIATYGEKMTITSKVPNTDIEKDYQIDLVELLDKLTSKQYPEEFRLGDFTFKMSPSNYKLFTDVALMRFEETRKIRQVQDAEMSDKEKMKIFNDSLQNLTKQSVDLIVAQIDSVQYQNDEPVTNKQHIADFFENVDRDLYDDLQKYIESLKEEFQVQPFEAVATEEEIAAGAPETYSVPVSFDQSNFFERG